MDFSESPTHSTTSFPKELPRISGAEAVIRSLLAEGVDTMFGYPGGDIEAGAAIRKAVNLSIEQNVVTEDIAPEGIKPSTTNEVGDFIARNI
ncbi:MAG: hypothetical protein J6U58_04455 [Bacteroidaceae bacterium]|nr:hypothetical protein [Bacteroidaceae bacterium]